MKMLTCNKCGSTEFFERDGYRICSYCNSKMAVPAKATSSIALNSDIERLLAKCEAEPWAASRYANLILDIDPTNTDALKYL